MLLRQTEYTVQTLQDYIGSFQTLLPKENSHMVVIEPTSLLVLIVIYSYNVNADMTCAIGPFVLLKQKLYAQCLMATSRCGLHFFLSSGR